MHQEYASSDNRLATPNSRFVFEPTADILCCSSTVEYSNPQKEYIFTAFPYHSTWISIAACSGEVGNFRVQELVLTLPITMANKNDTTNQL